MARIGLVVSTHIKETGDVVVNTGIKQLVEEYEGEVVPIDYRTISGDVLTELVKDIDGVILPGGGDMDPAYYEEDRLPECGEANPARDMVESAIMLLADTYGLPVLGICRGCQVINVCMGGTLYQDLPSQKSVFHRQTEADGRYCHFARIVPESGLHGILRTERLLVNSYHHEAVRDVAPELRVCAVSEKDGITEAVEGTGDRFILGIQWHPESIPEDPASKCIFKAFMDAVNNIRR